MSRQPRQRLKQRPDGRYGCRYKNKFFIANTEKECLRLREEYIRNEKIETMEQIRMTVERYASIWVSTYKQHLTKAPYNDHVRNLRRFCATNDIGTREISSITQTDIKAFYNTLSGKSDSTIKHARETINGMFRAALADKLIDTDPTVHLTIPHGEKGTHRAITEHERQLIHSVQHPLRPAVMLMLYAGLRRGEALALDVQNNIDFNRKMISVKTSLRFENQSQPVIVDPKTSAGTREIPLLSVL